MTSAVRRGSRRECGTSFLELLLAVIVIGVALVAASASQLGSLQVQAATAPQGEAARVLAEEIHQAALRLPWSAPVDAIPLFGGDVSMLSDLDGRVFSPPRSGADTALQAFEGWSQSVELRSVDPAEPTVPVQAGQAALIELSVTIHQGVEERGCFSWWLARPGGD